MLHTKFRGNRPAGSGGEDFLKGFYHMWAWRPSWLWDQHHVIRFSVPCSLRKFLCDDLVISVKCSTSFFSFFF